MGYQALVQPAGYYEFRPEEICFSIRIQTDQHTDQQADQKAGLGLKAEQLRLRENKLAINRRSSVIE